MMMMMMIISCPRNFFAHLLAGDFSQQSVQLQASSGIQDASEYSDRS